MGKETAMPRYMALIYLDESRFAEATPEDAAQMMKAYQVFTEETQAAGIFESGDGLQPSSTATSVRVRDGQVLTTDGPFAETKEALIGFYVLKCKDLDDAIEWAAKIPGAAGGSIEVRPVIDYEAR